MVRVPKRETRVTKERSCIFSTPGFETLCETPKTCFKHQILNPKTAQPLDSIS